MPAGPLLLFMLFAGPKTRNYENRSAFFPFLSLAKIVLIVLAVAPEGGKEPKNYAFQKNVFAKLSFLLFFIPRLLPFLLPRLA